jgi:hypothetical protein
MVTGSEAIFPSVYVLGVSVTGVLAVLAVSLFISTQSAAALEPGVHVDPGSPAAKQYALPLNQAREIGHSGAGPAAGTSPSLFGAGIGAARSHRAAVTAAGAGLHAREGAGSGVREERHRRSREGSPFSRGTPTASLDASHLDIAAQAGSGDGSLLALLGGGVAVLLLGGAGGVAMRRARRSQSSM